MGDANDLSIGLEGDDGPQLTLVRRGDGPDPRLIELVRLLARRAARQYFESQTRDRGTTRS